MKKKWRNQDWIWLISILIGVIIIILTWRLNDNDSVVNIISMFSSGASIILAIVAIVQSTLYNNSANELNIKMTEKLSTIENNSKVLIDQFLNDANKVIDNSEIDEQTKEEIKEDLENSVKNEMLMKNTVYNGFHIENKVFSKLKKLYSTKYEIDYEYVVDKRRRVDFKLENDKKIILIELKYIKQNYTNAIKTTEERLKDIKADICKSKEIIPIIIVVVPNENERQKLKTIKTIQDLSLGLVILTEAEVLSKNTKLFEKQIKYYID